GAVRLHVVPSGRDDGAGRGVPAGTGRLGPARGRPRVRSSCLSQWGRMTDFCQDAGVNVLFAAGWARELGRPGTPSRRADPDWLVLEVRPPADARSRGVIEHKPVRVPGVP